MTDATFEGATGAETKPRVETRKASFSRKTLLAVGGAILVAGAGAAVIAMPKSSVSTDAAYVQADSSSVAPKVRGLVAQVLVDHNQTVRRGEPLVRIDPEEFDARVASAQADIANAEAAAASARAALISLDAEQRLAGSNIRAAQTAIAAADAENVRAQADRKRYEDLADSGAVARRDVERFRAAAVGAQSAADRTRAQFAVSQDQAAVTAAKRATLSANLAQADAAVARARAAFVLARQDQDHTLIRSPIDGVVGDRQAEPGDYVQPGTRLMTIVPMRALYVVANFKETQVERMLPGQEATIKVDALGGKGLKGHVESFAPGSGSQFSLLPFEPGTGNFTKVVQRVPVRIRIDPGQADVARLRPGLSTTVKVRLKR
ncbi:HlyD family secretion protein [Caulobacter sp.]|uniref:HlyD family secretion protein n=1 Tax=Caulobacter sp. TaxID=78 RepID=UPI002B48D507|nr:HlyD family secretion protein [Caulobacter sp.]HJV41931.1 HlyD family secretion protein [Caulobacter sp.]